MIVNRIEKLPAELSAFQEIIEARAAELGLDFFPTIFEQVTYEQLNEIAAYGGFPTRYPHWRFGMEYEQLAKGYQYGLQKIYELVINTDPCYAYLMKSNSLTDQKLVMAHVYGHCDFFKNNCWFGRTNRKMMDQMGNHAQRVKKHMERHGVEAVEQFIDACLSLEDLIDPHSMFIRRTPAPRPPAPIEQQEDEDELERRPGRFHAKGYMESYINPPGVLKAEADDKKKQQESKAPQNFPEEPQRDVLLFLLEHAPLKAWQLDVLSIIRDEAYYFAPQGQTKIMNEGWASYWHSTMMTRYLVTAEEVVEYADHHSGTMATSPGRLNPYKLGIELFRHIEERWNKGQFGKEYQECDDWFVRERWDTGAGLGRKKIFEVRQSHNDLTFIDTFLTPEFCHEQRLFSFSYNESSDTFDIESREFKQIKQRLLTSLTNYGRPQIQVLDANYKNRGELVLQHVFTGVGLKMDYARDTLANLFTLWKRPVHLQTKVKDSPTLLSFDGTEHRVGAA